ncbi:hypothetical protein KV47_02490 [Staphylococcus haemolyticus]|uniref:DUF1381 domain-containing protein n=1 Tax=Staphylococcus haemolyticus TaxID=1283 RepID=UPI00056290C8|nr:DUF1381 domain-containing protein [Staphylococcus haemolyticus]MBW5905590.1 DUF1381 domain-containing protein [Staphylococcus haemolyticus]OCX38200.1 hypothetical protein KV47_02490 [Staphylococcus haemolyticus]
MMQFLIREFKDSTGHIHTDIEKARTNETLSIVEAESKEEAKKKVNSYYTDNSKVSSYKIPEDKTLKSLFGGK